MKLITLLMSCVLGYVLAHHDKSYFVEPGTWATVAGVGLALLMLSMLTAGVLPAVDIIMSVSVCIFLFGLCMAGANYIWPNKYFVGAAFVTCSSTAFFVMWMTYVLTANNNKDGCL